MKFKGFKMFAKVKSGQFVGELVRYRFALGLPSIKISELPWQELGLSYTASGYGKKIPTKYMVRTIDQKWRRVYCCVHSNIGTCYIVQDGENIIVEID